MRAATASVGLVSPRSTCESIGAETPERSARSRSDRPPPRAAPGRAGRSRGDRRLAVIRSYAITYDVSQARTTSSGRAERCSRPVRRRAHERALQRPLAVRADDDHARVALLGELRETLAGLGVQQLARRFDARRPQPVDGLGGSSASPRSRSVAERSETSPPTAPGGWYANATTTGRPSDGRQPLGLGERGARAVGAVVPSNTSPPPRPVHALLADLEVAGCSVLTDLGYGSLEDLGGQLASLPRIELDSLEAVHSLR